MNVLIAFESSGTVREAFRALGHNAWSLDILPADDHSPFHIQEDFDGYYNRYVSRYYNGPSWHLFIAHPPCTHLSVSGARHWPAKRADGRQQTAIEMFMSCINFPAPMSAIENPVGIMSSVYRKPDQYIQPFEFGHPESKKTGLWLANLPPLTPTNILPKPECGYWDNQTPSGQNKLGPSPDRWKIRSKTYDGIAQAMADQWTHGQTHWSNS